MSVGRSPRAAQWCPPGRAPGEQPLVPVAPRPRPSQHAPPAWARPACPRDLGASAAFGRESRGQRELPPRGSGRPDRRLPPPQRPPSGSLQGRRGFLCVTPTQRTCFRGVISVQSGYFSPVLYIYRKFLDNYAPQTKKRNWVESVSPHSELGEKTNVRVFAMN